MDQLFRFSLKAYLRNIEIEGEPLLVRSSHKEPAVLWNHACADERLTDHKDKSRRKRINKP